MHSENLGSGFLGVFFLEVFFLQHFTHLWAFMPPLAKVF
jgi:hypothetical protein